MCPTQFKKIYIKSNILVFLQTKEFCYKNSKIYINKACICLIYYK